MSKKKKEKIIGKAECNIRKPIAPPGKVFASKKHPSRAVRKRELER